MSHIFISYSTRNAVYANQLAEKLRSEGFDVWIDNTRLRSSEDWWRSIVLAIWDCAAFIVILSPEADKSKWVQREITLADQRNKPTFPILLDGDINTPNWAIFVRTQFEDVRGGKLPKDSFYAKIAQHVPRKQETGNDITDQIRTVNLGDGSLLHEMENPPPPDEDPTTPPSMSMTQKQSSGLPLMLMLGVIAILIAVIAVLAIQLVNNQPDISSTDTTEVAENILDDTPDMDESSVENTGEMGLPGGDPVPANYEWNPRYDDDDAYSLVPIGCFVMGKDDGDSDSDESPATDICFDEPFWIHVHEVSFEQWNDCVDDGACEEIESFIEAKENEQLNLPVNRVTWHQAFTYCDWDVEGGRLPTEAEWEYAARGPDSPPYPWGDEFIDYAVIWAENYGELQPAVEAEDRHDGKSWVWTWDMIGNVAEWTATEYREYPYDPDDGRDFPSEDEPVLVVRGGDFGDDEWALTATYRTAAHAYDAEEYIGFRCVRPYTE